MHIYCYGAINIIINNMLMLQVPLHNFKYNKNFYSLTQMSTCLVSNDLNSL